MENNVSRIKITDIKVNPHQPRLQFDEQNIFELADSIAENGLIQPVVVRRVEDGYELVAGERRLRAIASLEDEYVDAIVQDYDDKTSAKIAIIENIQRDNLSAVEEAIAYEKLIKDHGYTQVELAKSLGKSQSTIANKIRLLGLSEVVRNEILKRTITERHGRALLKINDLAQQERVLQKILESKLNVENTEKYIDKIINPSFKPMRKQISSKMDYRLEINTIKSSIDLIKKTGVNVVYDVEEYEDCVKIEIILKK